MGSSDMLKSEFSGLKYLSKKLTKNLNDIWLSKGWTLVSCSGTIGNTVYTNSDFENKTASQHIIRIVANTEKIKPGYLHAFLSTRFGYALLTQGTYGAVIQHIEPHHIAGMPVPLLPDSEQQHIHNLVEESARLRIEGHKKLSQVHDLFSEALNKNYHERKIMVVSAGDLGKYQNRLDASYNIGIKDIKHVSLNPKLKFIKIESIYEKCYIPNRGKRNYTEKGIPYLSTTDISTINPSKPEKFISAKTSESQDVLVKKDWILIARSGQEILGSVTIVGDAIADYAVNEHAIRLVISKEKIHPNYIFGFLSSPFGRKCLRTGIFGSAILTINEEYVCSLEIPILEIDKFERVINLIEEFRKNYDQAIELENQAIGKIEVSISSW
jgi:type I restriction enzyme S subunit